MLDEDEHSPAKLRDLAAQARRVARELTSDEDKPILRAFADSLEKSAEQLEEAADG